MPGRTFEDFEPGQVYELGSRTVTEEEIVDFARRFDPQPFHLDPDAARESVFGGLIASGWHTGAMLTRCSATPTDAARRASRSFAGLRRSVPGTRSQVA